MFKGIKKTLENLAKKQIVIAFEQSEKEVKDLSTRTSEALQVLKADGKQLGHNKKTLVTKKSIETKEKIKKISKKYFGMLNDKECIETLGITRNTFYKYVREIEGENKENIITIYDETTEFSNTLVIEDDVNEKTTYDKRIQVGNVFISPKDIPRRTGGDKKELEELIKRNRKNDGKR